MTEVKAKAPPNSLLVAIPSIGIVYSDAYASMLMAYAAANAYWRIRYPDAVVALNVISRKPADNARNLLSEAALADGFDWIWWVDDDQEIPERALEKLHSYNVDMASGIYTTKEDNPRALVFQYGKPPFKDDDRKIGWYLLAMNPGDLKGQGWADGTGFGCILMKRKVLQDVWNKTGGEPFRWSSTTTDDIHFFNSTRELGYRVLMDLDLKVGHWGMKQYKVPVA